jgi:hypothetical protein
MPPNFVLLDATLPDVTRLVAAMLQARGHAAKGAGRFFRGSLADLPGFFLGQ